MNTVSEGPETLSRALWPRTSPAFDRGQTLSGRRTVDVAIVGAGYAGLSSALHLAEGGHSVAVIEADKPGAGASGRNAAGWLPAYLDRTPEAVEALLGDARGRALNAMIADGARLVPELVTAHGMTVDMRKSGIVLASGNPGEAEAMRSLAASWNDRGGNL